MSDDRRAELEKAAMWVWMKGSGRVNAEMWKDTLSLLDLALEEAAKVAEDQQRDIGPYIAAAIRALKRTP